MKEKLLKDMLDYVELADGLIDELHKRPVFSDGALNKAAAALKDASLVGEKERDELVALFRKEPDKVLESLAKVAAALPRRNGLPSLGAPGEAPKATRFARESDRVLYERLGLG